MSTDTTFITNEGENNLRERFKILLSDTRFFDVLVGYFYTSGFYTLLKSLQSTEKTRILIGIGTNRNTLDVIQEAHQQLDLFEFSHAEARQRLSETVAREMELSEDNSNVEEGANTLVEWIQRDKVEIKAYPAGNIHAKLYIMTFPKDDKDVGRVITGSSNLTQAGLAENLEFNVELKDRSDYEFALAKFNELWSSAVDVSDKYVETITKRTWLGKVDPYELYLKFLYEYFKEKINLDKQSIEKAYLPEEFLDLEYQLEAVKDAKSKLDEYGGVFISDVVGLGKTYISAMLANQLDGRNLVIAPPALLHEDVPGSWPNVFFDFRVPGTRFVSIGKLDDLVSEDLGNYKNVFIDEAHRFRSEMNITYEKLAQICRGKRVILVSATPLNNSPRDILSQIKLFQKARKSTIPNVPNLESFFNSLEKKLANLDRQHDYQEYIETVKGNSELIRERVLKYLMVRRTRAEIVRYFAKDLERQKLKFPEVADPEPLLYQLNANEDKVFTRTIDLITRHFQYARYTPMLFYRGTVTQAEDLAQKNMRKFMKILLVKRLESSFFAFKQTIDRFVKSYAEFLREFDKGNIYVSKKYSTKLFELLDDDDDQAVQQLLDEDKAKVYKATDFDPKYRGLLEADLNVLLEISKLWSSLKRDPKLMEFVELLKKNPILKKNKLIVFTESRETAEYIAENINKEFPGQVLTYSGASGAPIREQVTANFDARSKHSKDDYRILVTTEVLSEGVNLHRSNVVVNYDIPWNPTRMMQRVGRINRVDTKFDKIYTFNFFPTTQSNDQIKLKEAAEYKIQAFIEMLGADARLLTDGEEIKSHDLFTRLTSKKTITGEDGAEESELKYLQVIRDIRDNNPSLFDQIKRLPKKARTGRRYEDKGNTLLTYFRKGKLQKFYLATKDSPKELDFMAAAQILDVSEGTVRENIPNNYYELLDKNKQAFKESTTEVDLPEPSMKGGRDSATFVLKVLKSKQVKHCLSYTEDDEVYVQELTCLVEEGALPKQTTKTLVKALTGQTDPLKILGILKTNVPAAFFKDTMAESSAQTAGPREVILSEYLVGDNG
ncbi:helicase-related protein [Dehalococcoides mccartyi]|uniref:helicase-related protein n=1 Tax=Dehalococcoides mccartyi TaxID=61435 RepID=UPI001AFBD176|nr:helicase-related protein [Dehalococcoides mccartyi]BCT55304.1 DNA/RNA helicases, SNF2 family [Dehalococcoides mccartyi]